MNKITSVGDGSPLFIVVMGPPGVGKGTQAGLLSALRGIPTVSTGALFRSHVDRGTAIGLQVSGLMAAGGYAPDDLTNRMLAERLSEPDARAGFILDGFPRTVSQVDELDRMLGLSAHALSAVILFQADMDVLVPRLARRAILEGRPDDTPKAIRHRIDLYESATASLAEVYESRKLLIRIDGDRPEGAVAASVDAALAERGEYATQYLRADRAGGSTPSPRS